jgi:hypothetical protein
MEMDMVVDGDYITEEVCDNMRKIKKSNTKSDELRYCQEFAS